MDSELSSCIKLLLSKFFSLPSAQPPAKQVNRIQNLLANARKIPRSVRGLDRLKTLVLRLKIDRIPSFPDLL